MFCVVTKAEIYSSDLKLHGLHDTQNQINKNIAIGGWRVGSMCMVTFWFYRWHRISSNHQHADSQISGISVLEDMVSHLFSVIPVNMFCTYLYTGNQTYKQNKNSLIRILIGL